MNNELSSNELLKAWLKMNAGVKVNRLLKNLSLNEITVCNIIKCSEKGMVTATELCEKMQLLKSQMNKILCTMEEKGFILRERSKNDRRNVYIKLKSACLQKYEEDHKRILELLGCVHSALGEEKTNLLATLLTEATAAVDQYKITTN